MGTRNNAAILRMSDKETLKFLKLCKQERVLWDPTFEGYTKRDVRIEAAKRIAAAMGLPDFTSFHVTAKFKNLRSSYLQEQKKIENSLSSGDDVYTPKVVWFDTMDSFLRPHVKPRMTNHSHLNWQNESMSPSSSSQNVIILDDPKLDDFVKREDEELSSTPPPYLVPTTHRSEEMPSDALIEVDCGAPRKKQKVGELKQTDPLGCGCANVDKGCERASNYPAVPKEDSFDFFGKYIASTLRGVPLQTALELQRDMISLIMNKCK
ncbi:uncharacterized protein LOC116172079 [Photinus pyralis]|uniref:MADF domain-containing protein n=1 Tax=Photinus pyralis TaxID=7054 RepID=A0A1Y1K376_PHOPY|nr:uncharacterized protein LOC116172079 [Photinus pyralis]XP_031345056.1 uncharacterized protein LOC116172079 [Photinus pyralis]